MNIAAICFLIILATRMPWHLSYFCYVAIGLVSVFGSGWEIRRKDNP